MADWTTFAAATVVLTLLLLYLTRRSQRMLASATVVDDASEATRVASAARGSTNRASAARTPDDREGPPRTFDDPDAVAPPREREGDFPPAPGATEADDPAPDPSTTGAAESPETESPDTGSATETPPATGGPVLTTRLMLVNVLVSQGVALLAVAAIAWWTAVPASAFGLGPVGGDLLVVGLLAGVVLYVANEAAAAVGERFGFSAPEELREAMSPTDAGEWILLLTVVLPVIAVFEEVLFRGALIGAFAVGFGIDPWLLAVVSSVAFGLGHGAQGRIGIVVTGLLGFVLAALFLTTGSLLVVIVAHYVVNALEFGVREGLGWEPFDR